GLLQLTLKKLARREERIKVRHVIGRKIRLSLLDHFGSAAAAGARVAAATLQTSQRFLCGGPLRRVRLQSEYLEVALEQVRCFRAASPGLKLKLGQGDCQIKPL